MIYLIFACALTLSGIAAFYAVVGLTAIFATAPIPIAIMGSTLEASKLVVASWLYRNWKQAPALLKWYLSIALCVLMFLTSMGIYGYLSKAHLDQAVPTGDVAAKVSLIDEKIKTEKDNIEHARSALSQMDKQVNETLNRTQQATDDKAVQRSITLRRQQAKERQALMKEIEQSQAAIAKLNEERAPIATNLRKIEAEVGPIKYLAALVYGDTLDQTLLEKAVRWVTLLIVAVFDPLAVVLLIAANWSLVHLRKKPLETIVKSPPDEVKETVKEIIKETVKEAKERKAKQTVESTPSPQVVEPTPPPIPEAEEHPVFTPNVNVWRSRPPKSS